MHICVMIMPFLMLAAPLSSHLFSVILISHSSGLGKRERERTPESESDLASSDHDILHMYPAPIDLLSLTDESTALTRPSSPSVFPEPVSSIFPAHIFIFLIPNHLGCILST